MEKRKLGNSDMEISVIGYGAWAVGGAWQFGWGPQDDDESIGAIHRALDLGVNWIDTAPAYGLGRSEEVVARALKGRSEQPYIFTKCSLAWNEGDTTVYHNLKAASIRQEMEDSLRRLNVDVIDLYQIHWPMPDEDVEEGWQTLVDLQAEGKVRYIAVSNFDVSQMQRAQAIAPITSLQPPYSAIRPEAAEEILPFCAANNIGVIVYSPMQSGLLTGKMTHERAADFPDGDFRKTNPQFQEPRLSRNLKLADLLSEIGQENGQSTPAVAVAWTLANPAVTGAIVGARRPSQVDGFIGAGDFRLSESDMARIQAFIEANP